MAENLVIVESPGKVKAIGKFLGKGFKVTASMGHVRDLPKSQMGVDLENGFEPKYINIRGKGDLINRLKKEAKTANRILLATDPDREGEAISWHLSKILNLDEKEKCRITFNEITKNAVKNAVKSPRQIDVNLVDAQQARRVLDRIVGYKISPILWKKVKKGLSAGRVQSVATRLVVEREEEIQNFIPEEYWNIIALLKDASAKNTFEAKFHGDEKEKIELRDKQQVDNVLKNLEGQKFIVNKVKLGDKKKTPAPPFITSTLQQEASRKLGFTPKKTMMVAQQLYEGIEVKGEGAVGLITYMRTDSMRISSEAQLEARKYIESKFGKDYLPEEIRHYRSKSGAQDAHEAIRPSHMDFPPEVLKPSLNNEQYKMYRLIWDRFVASQMAAAIYDTMAVDIKAGMYIFKANGSKIRFPGFIVLYTEGRDEDSTDDAEVILPALEQGKELTLNKLDSKQHFTQPLPRYTEAALVKALEEKGIGRPSTYAPTIETILSRGYVVRDKKLLIPTELGKVVTDIMKKYFTDIVNIQFTANMEQQLDDVEEGKKYWTDLMKEFYGGFSGTLKQAENEIGNIEIPDEESDVPCEKCGRMMVIKQGRFGKFLACPGFPQCRNAKPIVEEAGVDCPKCGGRVLVKKTKRGRKYYGCEKNPKCGFMTWDTPTREKCPSCASFLLRKQGGKDILKCSNEACKFQRRDVREQKTEKISDNK